MPTKGTVILALLLLCLAVLLFVAMIATGMRDEIRENRQLINRRAPMSTTQPIKNPRTGRDVELRVDRDQGESDDDYFDRVIAKAEAFQKKLAKEN